MFEPRQVVRTETELRALVGEPRQAQLTKARPRFDDHDRRWIAASPFVVVASADGQGRMDISPKGDPPGFVQVVDEVTLAVPDRPGNHRLDTFANVLQNPRVSLIFLVPGRGETLRVEGRAVIATDPDLLATMAERGRPPTMCLVVTLAEVMFHCGKSVIRSHLWDPSGWPEVDGLASYAQCLADQTSTDETVGEMESRFATWHEGKELY